MVPRTRILIVSLAAIGLARPIAAQEVRNAELKNSAFTVQAGPSGVTSVRRTQDVADTEYVAPNGALGRLIVRYRTSPHGDWKELRDPIETGQASGAGASTTITYALGALQPSIASRASGSAVQGVAGLRGLNDGLVPVVAAGGRGPSTALGAGRGPNPDAGSPQAQAPVFTWSPARGTTQWVQYTFPEEETIDRSEVFWTVPPQSWRVLYQDGRAWKEVA